MKIISDVIFYNAQFRAKAASKMSSVGFDFGAQIIWEAAMEELKAAYGMQPIDWYESTEGKYGL